MSQVVNYDEIGVSVYILRLTDNTYYTGITKNLELRLKQHNAGQSKSTKNKGPVVLCWHTECDGYKAARLMEVWIKSTGAKLFMLRIGKQIKINKSGFHSYITAI